MMATPATIAIDTVIIAALMRAAEDEARHRMLFRLVAMYE
jgi:hypothetical protein